MIDKTEIAVSNLIVLKLLSSKEVLIKCTDNSISARFSGYDEVLGDYKVVYTVSRQDFTDISPTEIYVSNIVYGYTVVERFELMISDIITNWSELIKDFTTAYFYNIGAGYKIAPKGFSNSNAADVGKLSVVLERQREPKDFTDRSFLATMIMIQSAIRAGHNKGFIKKPDLLTMIDIWYKEYSQTKSSAYILPEPCVEPTSDSSSLKLDALKWLGDLGRQTE